jgi:hypothetical protein
MEVATEGLHDRHCRLRARRKSGDGDHGRHNGSILLETRPGETFNPVNRPR